MVEKLPAVEITNLNFGIRDHWTYRMKSLLHDISLSINSGECFGFLGHNGAGKTTTIKCILNLLRPTAGQVKVFGIDSRETEARAQIGYLAEQPYFYDYLTVYEIMELYAVLAGLSRSEIPQAIKRALDLVNVSARAKSPMRSLSKGLTQRVGLAQALVAQPKLLILDEPFSGLDPIGRKEFRELFFELKSQGTTLFMSSHVLSDVEFLCDRVSILARGELKGVFVTKEIPRLTAGTYELSVANSSASLEALKQMADSHKQNERFLTLYFNTRENAERALQEALNQKAHVESFTFQQGTLEELFVKLVKFDEAGGSSHA